MHNLEDFMWQEMAYYTVACHTENCGNADIELLVTANLENPDVTCGVCQTDIEDVRLMPEDFNATSH